MTDPRRLLDGSNPLAIRLLRAAELDEPPPGARARALRFAAGVTAVSAGTAATLTTASSAGSTGLASGAGAAGTAATGTAATASALGTAATASATGAAAGAATGTVATAGAVSAGVWKGVALWLAIGGASGGAVTLAAHSVSEPASSAVVTAHSTPTRSDSARGVANGASRAPTPKVVSGADVEQPAAIAPPSVESNPPQPATGSALTTRSRGEARRSLAPARPATVDAAPPSAAGVSSSFPLADDSANTALPAASAPVASADPSAAPAPSSSVAPSVVPNAATFEEELRLVDRARSALAGGNASAALTAAARYRSQFPNGQFQPEMIALSVEALLARGDTERARQLAQSFLARFPAHPLATRVRQALRP